MSVRSFPLLLAALAVAAILASTGCEDEIAPDAGLPDDAEFLQATEGTITMFPAAVNPNLGLLRFPSQYEVMADVQRRLRSVVPTAVARDVVATETASADYDSTAGEWIVTGSATSGDTLRYDYSARIAWFDTLGNRMPEPVGGLTERGELRESVDLSFRTGDFDSLASYDVVLDTDLFVDVLVPALETSTADTFFTDATGRVAVRAKEAGAETEVRSVDFTGRLFGRTGPNRNSGQCYRGFDPLLADWNGLRATVAVNSNGTVLIRWFDPDETIQGIDRVLFAQQLSMVCR